MDHAMTIGAEHDNVRRRINQHLFSQITDGTCQVG